MKSLADAVGAKTARACDGCVKRRARWYCASDDAFLCQACDGTVHSANPLARKHERVRLKSASSGGGGKDRQPSSSPPPATWHRGFTRKARTPRGSAAKKHHRSIFHDLVPEISVEDHTDGYDEEQLICRVPVLDPMVAERYGNDVVQAKTGTVLPAVRMKCRDMVEEDDEDNAESCLNGFFPTDMELAEFAADVETLLGHGLETEPIFGMEELGLGGDGSSSNMVLKVEKEEVVVDTLTYDDDDDDVADDTTPFELSFDYVASHKTSCNDEEEDQEDDKENVVIGDSCRIDEEEEMMKKKNERVFMLRLNHEAVISSWGCQGPPWTAGDPPPEIDLDNHECWPVSTMGESGSSEVHRGQFADGFSGVGLQTAALGVEGREARVSRYREKRRTRLFSKKIRYEVRKLNAEKRPRMKGRFVKRASLASSLTSSSLFPLLTN